MDWWELGNVLSSGWGDIWGLGGGDICCTALISDRAANSSTYWLRLGGGDAGCWEAAAGLPAAAAGRGASFTGDVTDNNQHNDSSPSPCVYALNNDKKTRSANLVQTQSVCKTSVMTSLFQSKLLIKRILSALTPIKVAMYIKTVQCSNQVHCDMLFPYYYTFNFHLFSQLYRAEDNLYCAQIK